MSENRSMTPTNTDTEKGRGMGEITEATAATSEFFARVAEGEGEADVIMDVIRRAIRAERERCAKIAFGFTTSAHIAHDMREGNFPNRSEWRAAIAAMIRSPGHPYVGEALADEIRKSDEKDVVLEECFDYFDNKQDADYDSETGFIPNKEMILASRIREVLPAHHTTPKEHGREKTQ